MTFYHASVSLWITCGVLVGHTCTAGLSHVQPKSPDARATRTSRKSCFSPTCCSGCNELRGRRLASHCYAVTLIRRVRGEIKLKEERRPALWRWAAEARFIFNPTQHTVLGNRDIWWNMELSCERDTFGWACWCSFGLNRPHFQHFSDYFCAESEDNCVKAATSGGGTANSFTCFNSLSR